MKLSNPTCRFQAENSGVNPACAMCPDPEVVAVVPPSVHGMFLCCVPGASEQPRVFTQQL